MSVSRHGTHDKVLSPKDRVKQGKAAQPPSCISSQFPFIQVLNYLSGRFELPSIRPRRRGHD